MQYSNPQAFLGLQNQYGPSAFFGYRSLSGIMMLLVRYQEVISKAEPKRVLGYDMVVAGLDAARQEKL
jgi:hypothetical protein